MWKSKGGAMIAYSNGSNGVGCSVLLCILHLVNSSFILKDIGRLWRPGRLPAPLDHTIVNCMPVRRLVLKETDHLFLNATSWYCYKLFDLKSVNLGLQQHPLSLWAIFEAFRVKSADFKQVSSCMCMLLHVAFWEPRRSSIPPSQPVEVHGFISSKPLRQKNTRGGTWAFCFKFVIFK